MLTNSSTTSLLTGLAAFSLVLVVAGARLYRRRGRGVAARGTLTDIQVEAGIGYEEQSLGEEHLDDKESSKKHTSITPRKNFPLDYFILVFVLAVPFWIFGGGMLPLPFRLPVAALVTFVPVTAAAILSYRQSGFTGVKDLPKKALDYKKIKNKIWLLPALFLMPAIYFLSFLVMRLAGLPLPDSINVPLLLVPVFFLLFFIGDAGEELGWSGYAINPLQNRWGAVKASIILGVIWALWHTIPNILTHNPPGWVFWQTITVIPLRILFVWIYNLTGKSVFATILIHDTTNISWSLFPNFGSHYDPFVTGVITWLAAGLVIVGQEAAKFTRTRSARASR